MKRFLPIIFAFSILALMAFQEQRTDEKSPAPPVRYTDTVPDDLKIVFGMGGPYGNWEGYTLFSDGTFLHWKGKGIEVNKDMGPETDSAGVKHIWNILHNHDYFSMDSIPHNQYGMMNIINIHATGYDKKFMWNPAIRDSNVAKMEFLFGELHTVLKKATYEEE
ncbi:MAG: hypothetical protein ACLFQX_09725 [Candidatus Kapaibacterium sp.]